MGFGGNNNPLPVALPAECRKAAKVFSAFADPVNGLDKVVPAGVLRKAKGFAFLTVVKAGFVFSARAGSGVVIARLPDGNWSAPSAIGTAGAGFGMQVGAEMTDFFIILNSRAAVSSFMATGSLTLGGNMSVAAGPLGRNVEGTGTLSSKGGVSAMYSYSRTKGLFGGASVEGSVIVERSDANSRAYGTNVTAKQLLSGAIEVPEFAEQLIDTIARRSGNATNWVAEDDEDLERPNLRQGYSFGTQFAQGGQVAAAAAASTPAPPKGLAGKLAGSMGRSRSSSAATAAPAYGGSPKFDQDFGDDFARSESDKVRWGAREEDRRARSASVSAAGRGVKGWAAEKKLTKSRSGSGSASRDKTDAMSWGATRSPSAAARGSFDSLDDERRDYGSPEEFRSKDARFSSDDEDDDRRRSPIQRFPPSSIRTSPFADSASPTFPRHASSLSTSTSSHARPSPTSKKSYSTKPWDSEDEDLMGGFESKPRQRSPSPPRPKDAFDFSQVDVDFSLGQSGGRANLVSTPPNRARSRASTGGKGLGTAIAKFDFASSEPGDLAFKKGDVITVLKQEDAEWWTGRLAIREGIFPANYCDYIPN